MKHPSVGSSAHAESQSARLLLHVTDTTQRVHCTMALTGSCRWQRSPICVPRGWVAVGAVARLCVHRRAEHHDGGVADPLELGAGDPRTADVTREKQAVATGRVDRHLTTAHRATTPFHTADFI